MAKIYKKQNDGITSIMGENVQVDEEGKEFFELSSNLECLADTYTNLIWPAAEEPAQ